MSIRYAVRQRLEVVALRLQMRGERDVYVRPGGPTRWGLRCPGEGYLRLADGWLMQEQDGKARLFREACRLGAARCLRLAPTTPVVFPTVHEERVQYGKTANEHYCNSIMLG